VEVPPVVVYDIVPVPAARPVTTPVAEPTLTVVGEPLLHEPPEIALLNAEVLPTQIVKMPVIGASADTVTIFVAVELPQVLNTV